MLPDTTKKPSVIVIAGATATGKTAVAMNVAARFDGEIVSADSQQVYRYLNIGTAKPSSKQMTGIKHHLIDCVNPDEDFNASIYIRHAEEAIADIVQRNKTAIIVGGTGLYIKALLKGLIDAPAGDKKLRDKYRDMATQYGIPHLHKLLKQRDLIAAGIISPNDLPRIMRALETIEVTGKSIVTLREEHSFKQNRYRSLFIGLHVEKEKLFQRIEQRVDTMIACGLAEEVRSIIDRGYCDNLKSMNSLGYKQINEHMRGLCSLEEAIEKIKRETKKYAKRQLIWFKAQKEIVWLAPEDEDAIMTRVANFFSGIARDVEE